MVTYTSSKTVVLTSAPFWRRSDVSISLASRLTYKLPFTCLPMLSYIFMSLSKMTALIMCHRRLALWIGIACEGERWRHDPHQPPSRPHTAPG